MDINSINPDIIYITIILIIPLTIPIIHNKLKKYNNRKLDQLVGININKVLETTINNMLIESGMFGDNKINDITNDKVIILNSVIIRTIRYINKADTSCEFKIREGIDMIGSLLWEMDIGLDYEEEIVIRDCLRIGIRVVSGNN